MVQSFASPPTPSSTASSGTAQELSEESAASTLDAQLDSVEVAAGEALRAAEAEAQVVRDEAHGLIGQAQHAAREIINTARAEAESLIRQAQEARTQVLVDMDARRRGMRAEVERLRSGRDRLLASHELMRSSLDEIGFELKTSLTEARLKGEAAQRRVEETPLSTELQLETEVADASVLGALDLPPVERAPSFDSAQLPTQLRAAVEGRQPVWADDAPAEDQIDLTSPAFGPDTAGSAVVLPLSGSDVDGTEDPQS